MFWKSEFAKQHDGFRMRRIRSFITRNTLLNLVLLSVLFTCFWAVPAFADESAVEATAAEEIIETATAEPVAAEADAAPAVEPVTEDAAAPANEGAPSATDNGTVVEPEGEGAASDSAVAAADGTEESVGAADAVAEAAAQDQPLEQPCEGCQDAQLPLDPADCDDALQFLELICGDGFWDSMDDYNNGLLSIQYTLTNGSTDTTVNNLMIVSATATNGVKVNDDLPLPLGSLPPGEVMYFILKWQVPKGVNVFVTDISICGDCEEFCADCDPDPECKENCDPPVEEIEQPPVAQVEPVTPVMANVLPQTGIDMTKPIIFGLGLAMLGGLVPVARKAYRRIR